MQGCTKESNSHYEIVVIGASLGGLHALKVILEAFPVDFELPIVVVQHRTEDNEERLAGLLDKWCALAVRALEDKDPIQPGHIYIAPPAYHLLIGRGEFSLSTEAPVLHARPSIDVMFETAAEAYGPGVLGVLLTGASTDGARGLARIKQLGGAALVQDPDTAKAPTMPRAALSITDVDQVLELPEITLCIIEMYRGTMARGCMEGSMI